MTLMNSDFLQRRGFKRQWPHGTRARYVTGCRCQECREANRLFYHIRIKEKIFGRSNGLVSAQAARRHMLKLSAQGVGRRAIGAACGVADSILTLIRSGRRKTIRANTERRILSVTRDAIADKALVSNGRTWKLIDRLLQEGFTRTELARRLGSKAKYPALQI